MHCLLQNVVQPGVGLLIFLCFSPGITALNLEPLVELKSGSIRRGDCRDRLTDILSYINEVDGSNFYGIVSHTQGQDKWGYSLSGDNNYYYKSKWTNGYCYVVFKPSYSPVAGGPNTSDLHVYMRQILPVNGADCIDRAKRLNDMLQQHFQNTKWYVIVKKEPGGYDNWAFEFPPAVNGCSYTDWHGDYCYAVSRIQ